MFLRFQESESGSQIGFQDSDIQLHESRYRSATLATNVAKDNTRNDMRLAEY